jgi:uncharacterized protein (TIGR03083 family)
MESLDYVSTVREQSRRFAGVLEGADLGRDVPSCPGWTAADLVWHLAEVQHFWAEVVEGLLSDPGEVVHLEQPEHPALLDLVCDASARLVRVLTDADPDAACWTWADDRTVAFVLRRQAHEALIHRVDAEQAAGARHAPIDPALAADGVAEMVGIFLGGIPEWGDFTPDGATIRLEALDTGQTWGLAFGRFVGTSPSSGTHYDADAVTVGRDAVDPDTMVRAPAADLDLWLWGRRPLEAVDVVGAVSQARRLRQLAAESTQ